MLLNWFFLEPVRTLTISEPENAIALVVFVVVAVVVAFVVHTSARRAERAVAAQRESAALAELTHTLLGSTDQMTVLLEHAVDMFGAAARRRRAAGDGRTARRGRGRGGLRHRRRHRTMSADRAPRHPATGSRPMPPPTTSTTSSWSASRCRPTGSGCSRPSPRTPAPSCQRRALQQAAGEAAALARDSSARTALLSAVSHDLRTPLAGIKAAIGSLRSSEVTFSPEDEAELEAAIEDSADRLDALIGNLLDMSRLQAGALVAAPRPVDLGEVVPAAVAAVTEPDRVDWSLDPAARVVIADPGLLDRVLGNVVENALRHQPSPGRVRVSTSGLGGRTQVRVVRHRPRGAGGGPRADLPALPAARRRALG